MEKELLRQVLLYRGEDGYWVVECPSLPGCISQGQTKEEALKNIREAIELYIESLEEDNLPVPEEKRMACSSKSKRADDQWHLRRACCFPVLKQLDSANAW